MVSFRSFPPPGSRSDLDLPESLNPEYSAHVQPLRRLQDAAGSDIPQTWSGFASAELDPGELDLSAVAGAIADPIDSSREDSTGPNLSHSSRNDLVIGTAPSYGTYILIECPSPWEHRPLDTLALPLALRQRLRTIRKQRRNLKILLMSPVVASPNTWLRTLIFEKPQGLALGYQRREILVQSLDHLGDRLDAYFTAGPEMASSAVPVQLRDIFIPIPAGAIAVHPTPTLIKRLSETLQNSANSLQLNSLQLNNVRLWQTSAIGRYPFPPSLMDMPTGRFYGGLDWDTCLTILQGRGNLRSLLNAYRGWGLLPKPMQAAEGMLLAQYGWDWFGVAIAPPPPPKIANRSLISILHCRKPNGDECRYQVQIEARSATISPNLPQWKATYRISKIS